MPTTTSSSVELDQATAGLLAAYRHADNEVKRAEEFRRVLRDQITARLGENNIGTLHGRPVVRNTTVTTTRFDARKLRESEPDTWEKYAITTTSTRFTLVTDKDQPSE